MMRRTAVTLILLVLCAASWAEAPAPEPASVEKFGLAALGLDVSPPVAKADAPGSYERFLARAKEAYEAGSWGWALRWYKEARALHPEDRRDPEVLLMIADCAERALPGFAAIMDGGPDPEGAFGEKVTKWLRDTYGYYVEVSEGDGIWRYDKRALAEFLKRYPDHPQADVVAYLLATEDLLHRKYDPAVFFARGPRALACARDFVARYTAILHRYPQTSLRRQIESDIGSFQAYVKSGGPLPELRLR